MAGGAAALLGLFAHWYTTVPPAGAPLGTAGHGYGAFSLDWLGVLGPVFMIYEAARWLGAARGWSRVPAPSDWRRGARREEGGDPARGALPGALIGLGALGPVRRILPGPRRPAPHLPALSNPPRTTRYEDGSPPCDARHRTPRARPARSAGQARALLEVTRATVPTRLTVFAVGGTDPGRRDMSYAVHVDFGFWCMLVGTLLFLATSAAAQSLRPRRPRPSTAFLV
ncbi:hypothetical protein RVR_1315 [Actinacidiphila reveromycinica]|uniref:Uncharacterized protein n=1 Tax=Actinacidiphila reveromycinica TaxID=659352 RepID=A0A7U3UP51_9ACTN|nr:hypothetical protein [Streptomyces sp. SN-593]BBA96146.1 hypothetical protein RVR_1315 [Streptomyces sp. SN-593]